MSKNQTSQSQQSAPANDRPATPEPMAGVFELWTRMTRDGVARMQAFGDEWLAAETAAHERAKGAAEEVARLCVESIDYGARLATEWRKLGLETARRSVEMMEVKA